MSPSTCHLPVQFSLICPNHRTSSLAFKTTYLRDYSVLLTMEMNIIFLMLTDERLHLSTTASTDTKSSGSTTLLMMFGAHKIHSTRGPTRTSWSCHMKTRIPPIRIHTGMVG